MRTLVKVQIPVESGNAAIASGALPRTIEQFMQTYSPECAYFTAEEGRRTAIFVVDLPDPSAIPPLAEPFFINLGADVTLAPVMNVAELQAGLASLAEATAAPA